jgi:hypothetical protein
MAHRSQGAQSLTSRGQAIRRTDAGSFLSMSPGVVARFAGLRGRNKVSIKLASIWAARQSPQMPGAHPTVSLNGFPHSAQSVIAAPTFQVGLDLLRSIADC